MNIYTHDNIKYKLEKFNHIAVWGACSNGEALLHRFAEFEIDIPFFIDKEPPVEGEFAGKPVFSFEQIAAEAWNKVDAIFLAFITDKTPVINRLKEAKLAKPVFTSLLPSKKSHAEIFKGLLFNDEFYHETLLRIRPARFVFWLMHLMVALILVIIHKTIGPMVLKSIKWPSVKDVGVQIDQSMKVDIAKSYWKYSLGQIMLKAEEGFYYKNLKLGRPSLEIGTGDCISSNIFFKNMKIDIASDVAWRDSSFCNFKANKVIFQKIFNSSVTFDSQYMSWFILLIMCQIWILC